MRSETCAPVATSSAVVPTWPSLSIRRRSGLASNCGTPAGAAAGASIPGSRKGRGVPGSTPKKMPLLVEVAAASLMKPPVGATTSSTSTCTRMPSYFESWLIVAAGSRSAGVRVIGAGSGLPVETTTTVAKPAISVTGGLRGSLDGMKSCTVPRTRTRLPTAAAAGGVLLVKTKIPSEVLTSASLSNSGAWMKKPLPFTAVTTPSTCTTLSAHGEKTPAPWTSWMATCGTGAVTVNEIVVLAPRPCASETVTGSDFDPLAVLRATVATKENVPSPWSMNACVALPPMEERLPATWIPVLVGFAPGVTVTVRVVESPAETEGASRIRMPGDSWTSCAGPGWPR